MKPRVAVAGAGAFGKNHLRVIHQSEHAELAGVYDLDPARPRRSLSRIDAACSRAWTSSRKTPTRR